MLNFTERQMRCHNAITLLREQTTVQHRSTAIYVANRELAALRQAVVTQRGVLRVALELVCLQYETELDFAIKSLENA